MSAVETPLFSTGDAMRVVQDKLDGKNFYAFNPAFDKKQ
jgi:hypothetical protein